MICSFAFDSSPGRIVNGAGSVQPYSIRQRRFSSRPEAKPANHLKGTPNTQSNQIEAHNRGTGTQSILLTRISRIFTIRRPARTKLAQNAGLAPSCNRIHQNIGNTGRPNKTLKSLRPRRPTGQGGMCQCAGLPPNFLSSHVCENVQTSTQMNRKTTGQIEFALEDHLLWIVEKQISAHFVSKTLKKVVRFMKLPVGMIVPDLVLIATRANARPPKHSNRVPSLFECEILATLLKRGPLGRRTLARLLYARETSLERAVLRLVRDKLLRVNRAGALVVRRDAFPSKIKIVSVEAKLRRWKDAIRQAKEYHRFSNHSYVALPKTVVDRNPRLQNACRRERVGLISVSAKKTELILATKNVKPITAERIWLIRKVAALHKTPRPASNGYEAPTTSKN